LKPRSADRADQSVQKFNKHRGKWVEQAFQACGIAAQQLGFSRCGAYSLA
jgi:hypothetical protein